jgi:hypothetical protein
MLRPVRGTGTMLRLCTMLAVAVAAVVVVAVPSASSRSQDLPGYPEQPDLITLSPLSETNWVGEQVTHTATITANEPPEHRFDVVVTFTVLEGPSTGRTFTAVTDNTGSASFTYTVPAQGQTLTTLPNAGADQIQASFFDGHDTIGSNWVGQGWSQAAVGESVPGRPPALVQAPGQTTFAPANSVQELPPGTTVDITGRRAISVLNYVGRKMTFLGVPDQVPSRFILVNGLRTPGKVINIKLTGGNFATCGTRKGRSLYSLEKKPTKPVRRLWGSGKGKYTTKGKYASATVRGTFWDVADYCNGTLVEVRSGTVEVKDLVSNKLIVVRAGQSYFAKAP